MPKLPPMRYDAAVIGMGGMGAAALAHLARRGARTIGIDRYPRGHELGASSGESRIIRKAYFEDAAYVPLLERAYTLWRELEGATQRTLLDLTGMLLVGEPERAGIAGTLRAARQYDLPLEVYQAADATRRFPGSVVRPSEIALLERQAGIVFPEAATEAHLALAGAYGADLRFGAAAVSYEKRSGEYRITLADGATVSAARVVVVCGTWTPAVLADLDLPLRMQRNVQIWFRPSTRRFDRHAFPAYFVDRADFAAPLYGFPAIDGTLKAALHGFGDSSDAEMLDRTIRDLDIARVKTALDGWMPGAAASYERGKVCAYDLSPDGNFIVDRHPSDSNVTIACGFSGHGYKFCPVIGEIVADLALHGDTHFDIDFLRLARFRSTA